MKYYLAYSDKGSDSSLKPYQDCTSFWYKILCLHKKQTFHRTEYIRKAPRATLGHILFSFVLEIKKNNIMKIMTYTFGDLRLRRDFQPIDCVDACHSWNLDSQFFRQFSSYFWSGWLLHQLDINLTPSLLGQYLDQQRIINKIVKPYINMSCELRFRNILMLFPSCRKRRLKGIVIVG